MTRQELEALEAEIAAEDAAFAVADATRAAEAAFWAYAEQHGGMNGDLAQSAYCNAFAVEVWAEYADDLQRWTVALGTAREYVDQGVTSF